MATVSEDDEDDVGTSDEPQTAMLLTQTEWIHLAYICQSFLEDRPGALVDAKILAERIIKAAD